MGGISNELLKGIKYLIKVAVDNAPFDKTKIGIITRVISTGLYEVKINDVLYQAKSLYNTTLAVNDIVRVLIPENQYSNMIILN